MPKMHETPFGPVKEIEDYHKTPHYPEITRSQWAVLVAMTDQRCQNMMEAMDFYSDLSPEAKKFLKEADKVKIEQLNSNLAFFANSKTIWRFIWVGSALIMSFIFGAIHLLRTFEEYFTIKWK